MVKLLTNVDESSAGCDTHAHPDVCTDPSRVSAVAEAYCHIMRVGHNPKNSVSYSILARLFGRKKHHVFVDGFRAQAG